jgi:outer membrane lipoprotein-sorting protein
MQAGSRWAVRFSAVAMTLASGVWAADDLAAVFAKMDQNAPKFKGMRADVKRISHVAIMNDDSTDSGTVVVRVPKPHDYHMLIDFQQPDKKAVEVSGTMVRMYYPKTNEVQEKNLGKENKGLVEQFLKLGFGSNSKELQDSFTITYGAAETVAGQKTWRIVLVPKSQDLAAQFSKFELWISEASGISIQQKMYEPGGNYTLATYPNMKLDSNIPESAVKLNLPKGVTHRPL